MQEPKQATTGPGGYILGFFIWVVLHGVHHVGWILDHRWGTNKGPPPRNECR